MIVELAACWAAPLVVGVAYVYFQTRVGNFGYDFEGSLWEPARLVLHGHSPYSAATVQALSVPNAFMYPPIGIAPALPLAALPLVPAEILWASVIVASLVGALWILEVRDPRVFGFALLTFPVFEGLVMGNLSMLFVLGLAVLWRWRDRPNVAAPVLGMMVAMKLFLWPLFVWLLVTRRFRTAAIAAGIAVAAVTLSWAGIGFDGLREYPHLLRLAGDLRRTEAYSVFSLGTGLGLSWTAASALQNLVGVAILVSGAIAGRGVDGDRRAFSGLVVAALILSPVVWLHYFALLVVPLALRSPSMSRLWFLPLTFWLVYFAPSELPVQEWFVRIQQPVAQFQRAPQRTGPILVMVAAIFVATTFSRVRSPWAGRAVGRLESEPA